MLCKCFMFIVRDRQDRQADRQTQRETQAEIQRQNNYIPLKNLKILNRPESLIGIGKKIQRGR